MLLVDISCLLAAAGHSHARPAAKAAVTAESQDALLAAMLGGGETSFSSGSPAAPAATPQRRPEAPLLTSRHTPASRGSPAAFTPVRVPRCWAWVGVTLPHNSQVLQVEHCYI